MDSLNFSFWTDEGVPKYVVSFKGAPYTGYMALCAAVNRAIEVCIKAPSLTDPTSLLAFDHNLLSQFRSVACGAAGLYHLWL